MIADLHCDLLSYLAQDEKRSPCNGEVRCSLPQLKKGNVIYQTLAIFTETGPHSVVSAEKQFSLFSTLPQLYRDELTHLTELKIAEFNGHVQIAAAIENASGLCSKTEPLENCFDRFDQYRKIAGPIVYISLTWNHENRFGGGNLSPVGLKRDGELLLDYLDGKGIAIDLSHTSDALASAIFSYIDKKGLRLIPIASHSNFRAISNHPRNLSDEIAREILRRGGVIGLNFFKPFIGNNCPTDFMRQVDHARSLGALDQYCMGADFFYDGALSSSLAIYPYPFYYEPFGNAGCYLDLINYLTEGFTLQEIEKIAYSNLTHFFERIRCKS